MSFPLEEIITGEREEVRSIRCSSISDGRLKNCLLSAYLACGTEQLRRRAEKKKKSGVTVRSVLQMVRASS